MLFLFSNNYALRRRFQDFCDSQEERMLFVLSNALPCAGSWTSVIVRRRVCSSCLANTFSCPGSWIFVIYRRRVCSSCFLIWSRAPVPGLL